MFIFTHMHTYIDNFGESHPLCASVGVKCPFYQGRASNLSSLAHTRQSRLDADLGSQAKLLQLFPKYPSPLRRGLL